MTLYRGVQMLSRTPLQVLHRFEDGGMSEKDRDLDRIEDKTVSANLLSTYMFQSSSSW